MKTQFRNIRNKHYFYTILGTIGTIQIFSYIWFMGAPVGNQFWMLRAKHGRDKLFSDPALLWESACEYFQWCEENQLIEIDFKGKDADRVELPKMRAFTWDGLELYLDIYSLRDYKTNESYKDFSQVIIRIEKVIYNQKFTGAAAGFLNPNIIARDLGLSESSKHTIQIEQPLFGDAD